jgi:hypothetical protein
MIDDTHPDENLYCKQGPLGWVTYDCGEAVNVSADLATAKEWVADYFQQGSQHLNEGESVNLSCAFYNNRNAMIDLITSTVAA